VRRDWAPQSLCRLADLAEGQTRGFTAKDGGDAVDIFVQRRGAGIVAYVNSCPHTGSPLDWLPDRFVADDGRHFLCATHGALFRPEDGYCVAGPCAGDSLEAVPVELRDDEVRVAGGARPSC
jgi:nitrite reductase/ring-hydroxylating ferredoxin subunit